MSKSLWKALGIVPAMFGVALLWGNMAQAGDISALEQVHSLPEKQGNFVETRVIESETRINYNSDRTQNDEQLEPIAQSTPTPNPLSQITPVSKLSEIQPTDSSLDSPDPLSQITPVFELSDIEPTSWEFQVLQSLNERYGCLRGYPNGIYRGNQSLTRYEFAAALSVCLNQLIQMGQLSGEVASLQQLIEQFEAELMMVQWRIENLEEASVRQFSTTTKFEGEVLFALSYIGGEKADGSGDKINQNLTLSNQIELEFDTSFTGEDRLRLSLEAKNLPELGDIADTDMARLDFEGSDDNNLELDSLEYRFPVGDDARVYIFAEGDVDSPARKVNLAPNRAISRFGGGNPIYELGGDAGVGLLYEFNDVVSVSLGYAADDANEPDSGLGSEYGALVQLAFTPNDNIGIALAYLHSYNIVDTGTGSDRANDPFDDESDHVVANSFGLDVSFRVSSRFLLGGWISWTQAQALNLPDDPQANIFNYALTLTFPDLGREGNLGGIILGQPPKLINNDFEIRDEEYKDEDTSWHLEAFYTIQINDNIEITPGLLVILNPEHDHSNDTIYVGTIVTTFSF